MPAGFDGETLDVLDRAMEVDVETARPDGMFRRTTIWLIVDGDAVFARSWRGGRAHWYQAALDEPEKVSLHVGQRSIPVRVALAIDNTSVNRCSRGLQLKYAGDPATPSMVRPEILGTTVRFEPR